MTPRERFRTLLAGGIPDDRFPMIEWASWWHLTIERWRREGLPEILNGPDIKKHLNLDIDYQHWFPQPGHGAVSRYREHWIESAEDYEALKPYLYPDPPIFDRDLWAQRSKEQQAGEAVLWISVNGFFWWPRVLFGIEPHLYAFYDCPELMHRINQDQADYMIRCFEAMEEIFLPDFMTFAEDMSYNHGPMISRAQFDEFMAPYYLQVVPWLKSRGIKVLVDSDGDVEPLIPWLESVGIEGILPLERMAGVDVNRIRKNHPEWIMIGGFDKTVMHRGESAMRQEFNRLRQLMAQSRFILSVDHQTPPEVSLFDYHQYLSLLSEFSSQ